MTAKKITPSNPETLPAATSEKDTAAEAAERTTNRTANRVVKRQILRTAKAKRL
jgi:hypothetical protein